MVYNPEEAETAEEIEPETLETAVPVEGGYDISFASEGSNSTGTDTNEDDRYTEICKEYDVSPDGATFTITDASGNVVDTVSTDEKGYVYTKYLPPGTYTVQETVAPDGLCLTTETVEVTIEKWSDADALYTAKIADSIAKAKIKAQKK